MSIKIITPPAEEPLTVADAKLQSNVFIAGDDTLIQRNLIAARRWAEGYTQRPFVTQTRELSIDCFPRSSPQRAADILLRDGPIQSVTTIKYIDGSGTEQTIADAQIDLDSDPARIRAASGSVWPGTRLQLGAVKVRYVCGYGNAAAVPADIKAAILLVAADLYINREQSITGQISKVPTSAEYLLAQYMAYTE